MRPRGALEILEESLGLLRGAPAAAFALYLTGAIPFSLALLFFLTEMLRSPFAADRLALESLAVALLLLWKHAWQALFAARLHAELSPRETPSGSLGRMVAIQCAVQPLRLVVVPASLLATVPFASVVAFFRNLALFTALGDADPVTSARRMASIWMRQNWALLTVMSLAALLLFANVFIVLIAVPALIRTVGGSENEITRLGAEGFANLTTAAVAASITWLVIDPLLTAAYVLRCFYGASVATGEDLTAALRRAIAAAAMVLVVLGCAARTAHAQPPQSAGIDVQRLDHAIGQTIRQREFTWRSPPLAKDDPHARWTSWLREVVDAIGRGVSWVVKHVIDWLNSGPEGQEPQQSNSLRAALKLWTGVVAIVLVAAVLFFVLRRRGTAMKAVQSPAAAAPVANLADESLTADRLPESSWRKLAEESLARGEYRLALRALYLAGLNYMSQRELVSIRRWKSGLDYRREVERRSRMNPIVSGELVPAFARNVSTFERGWYGRHPVNREDVETLMGGLDELRRHAERQ